jgi:hypothetical protein
MPTGMTAPVVLIASGFRKGTGSDQGEFAAAAICRSHEEVAARTSEHTGLGRAYTIFELTGPIHELDRQLSQIPVRKRGRRGI